MRSSEKETCSLRAEIAIFYNKDVSHEEIAVAGERFSLAWYGAEKLLTTMTQAIDYKTVFGKSYGSCHRQQVQ